MLLARNDGGKSAQEDLGIQGIQWLHAFEHCLAQVFSLLWMPTTWRTLLTGIKRLLGGFSQGCACAARARCC